MTASESIDTATVGVVGWRCIVCDATVDISVPLVFRCPNWSPADPYHSLRIVRHDAPLRRLEDEPNPFVAYRPYFAWDSFAAENDFDEHARRELVIAADERVAAVAGPGFSITPFERSDTLSHELGFTDDGGIWIKDETHQVAGSHKARHLFSTMLHLLVAEKAGVAPWSDETRRPRLAIASCGNAALAAATLAAAERWPIDVFVPPTADPAILDRLGALGATITTCPRRPDDPAGDPCIHRFREAVRSGAIPFSVQGPENAWCLDGGRTIGWEMAEMRPDHLFVQVGGGALARCAISGLAQAGPLPKIHAVQTEACSPLSQAWHRVLGGEGGVETAVARRNECMTPWTREAHSAAEGILDDETYDWLALVTGMAASHGAPVIAREAEILRANALARELTHIDASATGTAGLAGLLAIRDVVSNHQRVALIFSGIAR
jgi:threonine synthase